MKKLTLILVAAVAWSCLALTPEERTFVEKARQYMAIAKEQAAHNQQILEAESSYADSLEQITDQQKGQIETLGKDVKKHYDNEVAQGEYIKKVKPTIDQVNSYWGLGAFAYGFKVLARHLFILTLVLTVAATALYFLAPAVFAAIRVAFGVAAKFISTGFRAAVAFIKRIYESVRKPR